MKFETSRRGFLKGTAGFAALAAGGCAVPWVGRPTGKIRLAAAGVMGKGFSDWFPMVQSGLAELVALCDADARQFAAAQAALNKKKFPLDLSRLPQYTDYRKMMDDIDSGKLVVEAMTVSTPDHMHAPIAITAMKMGIHVYVQKPLVRTLAELKYFGETARDEGVVTQMGNQGSGGDGFRRNVEILQSGVLGDVTEVHVWTNRPVWPQGRKVAEYVNSRKTGDAIPPGLDWNAWLGTAAQRPFLDLYPNDVDVYDPWKLGKHVYHPFTWRGMFDFGAGAFGDMACHTMNLPFRGLELGTVTGAECEMIDDNGPMAYPLKSRVRLTYAARESQVRPGVTLPEVKLYWYDGDQQKNGDEKLAALMPQVVAMPEYKGKVPQTGCLIVGTKGILCSCADYGQKAFIALKGEKIAKLTSTHPATTKEAIPVVIPRCTGAAAAGGMDKSSGAAALSADGHYIEFLRAIRGDGVKMPLVNSIAYSDVDYTIPLMEGILVGTVAQQIDGPLSWCSEEQKFNNRAANELLKPFIRRGFEF